MATLPYLQVLSYDFVFDDPVFIEKNPAVVTLRPVGDYFTDPSTLSSKDEYVHQIYRPLRTLLFAALHALFGLNPVPYHLLNLLLHVGCTLLLFSLGGGLLRRLGPSFTAAAIFAVHPVHAEAVTWISSLADVLSSLMVLIALRLYLMKDIVWRVASVAVVMPLALLSKEMAITLPVLLLVMHLFKAVPSSQTPFRAWGVVAAAFSMSVGYFFWRAHVLGQVGQTPWTIGTISASAMRVHLVLFEYLYMLVVPHPLCSLRTVIDVAGVSIPHHLIAGLSSAMLVSVVVVGRRKQWRIALFSALFMVTLLPVLNLLPVVVDVAERFAYLPSCFFALGIADGIGFLSLRLKRKAFVYGLVGAVVFSFGVKLVLYNLTWRTPLSVALAQTRCEPPDPNAYWNLGTNLAALERWEEARLIYEKLLAFDPERVATLNNLAYVNLRLRRFDATESLSRRVLGLAPGDVTARHNLGAALTGKGMYSEAIALFETVVADHPDDYLGHLNLGVSLFAANRSVEAATALHKALRIRPGAPEALLWLSRIDSGMDAPPTSPSLQSP